MNDKDGTQQIEVGNGVNVDEEHKRERPSQFLLTSLPNLHEDCEELNQSHVPWPLPGALHVPGSSGERDIANSTPVATEIDEIVIINDAQIVNEDIIDGEIVDPSNRTKSKYFRILIPGAILLIILIISVFVSSRPSESVENNLPPASELSARSQAIKNILIPISGEDALNDKKSPQYLAFEIVAELAETVRFPLNNTKRMIQRYSVLTTIASILTVDLTKALGLDQTPAHEWCSDCCNEFGEVSDFQLSNLTNIPRIKNFNHGTIPKEVGQLTGLINFIVNSNRLHMTIPTELGMLENLQVLDLRANKLTGTIPTDLGRLSNLQWAYLDRNFLSKSIPSEIGNMDKLFYMNISHNDLIGSIPLEFGKLERLNGFDISNNSITGDVDFLCKNNFTGEVVEHKIVISESRVRYYSNKMGLVIDCVDDSMLQCSCCDCVF